MHAPDGQHPSPDNGRPVLFLCPNGRSKKKEQGDGPAQNGFDVKLFAFR
jgi:hypothetical protein